MKASQSPQQLVQYLRGRGLSVAEIASELHRSPRMVRKVLDGTSRGEVYRATLEQLATTGRATTIPPRRRAKDGSVVRVRAAAGSNEKSVTPIDEGGQYAGTRQGGRLHSSTTYLAGGSRQHELHIPKGKTAKGRSNADSAILGQVRAAAKGQAHNNQKQIRTTLTFSNGRVMEVNTYNASTMLKRISEHDGSPLEWFRGEAKLRYTNLDVSAVSITGVTMTVYDAPKTNAYNRGKSDGRRRSTRALTPVEIARSAALAASRGGKPR